MRKKPNGILLKKANNSRLTKAIFNSMFKRLPLVLVSNVNPQFSLGVLVKSTVEVKVGSNNSQF